MNVRVHCSNTSKNFLTDRVLGCGRGLSSLLAAQIRGVVNEVSGDNRPMKNAEPLSQLDFLLVFDAIIACKSITKAAEQLGISQSALSHTLVRLRARFGDPLFVRSGSVMMPTPLVLGMAEPLSRSMAIIRDEILAPALFDPATTTRVFRVCVNEVGAFLLIPKIVKLLQKAAPHASLAPMQIARADIFTALESDRLDLAIGHYPELKTSVYQQTLFKRSYVAIVRKSHPTIGDKLSAAQLYKTPIIRNTATAVISKWLEMQFSKAGQKQIIASDTPYAMAQASLVAATNWIAFIPEELAPTLKNIASIRSVEIPFSIPVLDVKQHWHRRQKEDQANRFIRQIVYAALHE